MQELEALHMKEMEKSNKLELEMVAQQKEWQQQQEAEQQSRYATMPREMCLAHYIKLMPAVVSKVLHVVG